MSKTTIVQYQTRPDAADENQRLVEQVFAQLASENPEGLRYSVFRMDDGVTFVHVSTSADDVNPLTELTAFKEYLRDIGDRLVAPAAPQGAKVVGSYAD